MRRQPRTPPGSIGRSGTCKLILIMRRSCLLALSFCVSGLFHVACNRPTSHSSQANPQPKTGAEQAAPLSAKPLPPPHCPQAGLPPLSREQPGTGHHRVILAWNASVSSSQPGKDVAGYCLYRSTKRSAVKKNPTCKECEQVNVTPFESLSCVDDLVKDGTTYYYVVTAINSRGRISPSSNDAPAVIRCCAKPSSAARVSSSQPSSSQSPPPPLLCRGTPTAK